MKANKFEEKWIELINWLTSKDGHFFRGVGDRENHLLLPSVGRLDNYTLDDEINLFEQFKLKASLQIPKVYNDFEWMVLAQHHGLPTRLLDWTANPLVAAYFATSNTAGTGRIYALPPYSRLFVDISKYQSPFEINEVCMLMPPTSTKRIELQSGLFSVHPLPNKPAIIGLTKGLLEIEKASRYNNEFAGTLDLYRKYKGDGFYNYQEEYYSKVFNAKSVYHPFVFDIEEDYKQYINHRLRSLGVDETIFGDIDSIAIYLKKQLEIKKLHAITTPSNVQLKSILKDYIEENLVEYLKKYGSGLMFFGSSICYDENILLEINEIDSRYYNKQISGNLFLTVRANINNESSFTDSIPMNEAHFEKYRYIAAELKINNDLLKTAVMRADFYAEVYFDSNPYYNNHLASFDLKFRHKEVVQDQLMYLRAFVDFYNLFTLEEHQLIKDNNVDSPEFKVLIENKKAPQ